MSLSRRDFVKFSGTSATGVALGVRGVRLAPIEAAATSLRIKEAKVFPGVCPYCAVGCAQVIYVKDGKIIDIEGDPDTPHTEGALSAPKGRRPTSSRSTPGGSRSASTGRRAVTSGRRNRSTG